MKKILYSPFLLLTLLLASVSIKPAHATHCVGGDLTYTYVSQNTYLLTLRFYRDCAGVDALTTKDICYSSAACGFSSIITLNAIAGTGQEIPPSPCLPSVVSTCQGGTGYGVQEWIYQGTVTLPQACADWIFAFELCCRNLQISTIVNLPPGGTMGIYISTHLDNLNYAVNSSPYFNNIPVTQFCVNNQFYYDQQASDPDGDSLSYSIVDAEGNATNTCYPFASTLVYQPGFSGTVPINTLNGVTVDPYTGLISFIPTVQQVGVICIQVDEFRNGVHIGSVKRDIQMNVTAACLPSTPVFDSTMYNNTLGQYTITAACGDTSVIIAFQNPIQCGSIVSTDVRATDPNGLPNPVLSATAINCQSGLTDSILVTFLQPFTAGTTYLFTKIGNDGNTFLSACGGSMPEFDSIAVIVIDSSVYSIAVQNVSCFFTQLTVTFSEDFSCNSIAGNASDFQFVDATGTTYPILSMATNCSTSSQYSYTNQITFTFNQGINGTGPYYLIVDSGIDLNTIANKCGTFFHVGDTLGIFNVTNNIIVNLGPDITVCASDPLPVLDAGNPGVTFAWYFNGVLLPTDTVQTLLADSTGTYSVVCFYSGTCQGSDTIMVTISPAPIPNVGADTSICAGDTPPTFVVTGVSGTATYQWYFNGFLLAGDTMPTLVADTSLGSGNYSVIVNTGGSCNGNDNLNFTINPALVPNVGPDLTICQNAPLTLFAGVTANSYQWYDQFGMIPGATGSSYLVNTGGTPGNYTYYVIATGPCQGADTMHLTILDIPNITLSGNTIACITDTLFIYGSGSGTIQWYVDNVLSVVTDSSYIIILADSTPHTYTVVVSNGTCSDSTQIIVTLYPSAPPPTVTDIAFCSGSSIPPLDAGVAGTGVTYQWYNSSGAIPGATGQQYTPADSGTYSVTVSIGGGLCTSSASATVTQVTTPQPSVNSITLCPNDNFPLLNANATGTSYQWYFNNNPIAGETNSSYQTSVTLGAGVYGVTVTTTQNGTNCIGTDTMTLTINPAVTVSAGNDQIICEGSTATFNATSNTGTSYQWSNNSTSQNIQTGTAGAYTVTATDAGGCKGTSTVNLFVNPAPSVSISSAPDTVANGEIKVCKVDPFPLLTATTSTSVTYSWSSNLSGTINNGFSTAPSVQVASGGYGTYTVVVTDANLCTNTTLVKVTDDPCALDIPNIITPNGDTHNQVFFIKNIDTHPGRNLKIFNRWGNKVLDADNYNNDWSGEDLPAGTYYYILFTVEQTYTGTITLIRDTKK